jgi:hypothetical protein
MNRHARSENDVSLETRNNCYSLLHQLLNDEKDVSILRFIKHEDSGVKKLIIRVAESAKAGEKKLDEFTREDRSLVLNDYALPPGEQKTRDSIAAAKQKELLHSAGDKFELALLLTQVEALNYGAHLAEVARLNDFNPERAQYLARLSDELDNLREEVTGQLELKASQR